MINRPDYINSIKVSLKHSPVVALVGPRQCGKTTLARIIAEEKQAEYLDLEDPADLARMESSMIALENTSGLVIIDEIQRRPELFSILRVLVDQKGKRRRFLVLGSASPYLIRNVSETLAGRIAFVEMDGFDSGEVGIDNYRKLWLRGGFPRSYLARTDDLSFRWRTDFIRTFLERDIPQLGISVPAAALRRFWTMMAHFHGQIWNAAEFARSLGSSEGTVRRYLDLLTGAFVIRQLQPWFENIKKRQIKSPKIYIRDSGLLHALLSIRQDTELFGHPKYGASWEGFALEQTMKIMDVNDTYFWSTHAGAEIDLLAFRGHRRFGFEFKCEDAPRMTKSIRVAMEDLKLDKVFVVYPGTKSYSLDKDVRVVSILHVESVPEHLGVHSRRK